MIILRSVHAAGDGRLGADCVRWLLSLIDLQLGSSLVTKDTLEQIWEKQVGIKWKREKFCSRPSSLFMKLQASLLPVTSSRLWLGQFNELTGCFLQIPHYLLFSLSHQRQYSHFHPYPWYLSLLWRGRMEAPVQRQRNQVTRKKQWEETVC